MIVSASFSALILSSGCGHFGPDITGCRFMNGVNDQTSFFRCVKHGQKAWSWNLVQGHGLMCTTPFEFENFLKACKKKVVLDVTTCLLNQDNSVFNCQVPNGGPNYQQSFMEANNDFCVSPLDLGRIKQRCGQAKELFTEEEDE